MFDDTETLIRALVRRSQFRLTMHAREEMDSDQVSTSQLEKALVSRRCEIIEDYPEDKRGHSHLVLGWLPNESPLHVCCAVHEGILVIITVYRPDPAKWTADWRHRR